ncbi:MAG: hypothetical protein ACRCWC_15590, partial [Plesiomonas shigelloides]
MTSLKEKLAPATENVPAPVDPQAMQIQAGFGSAAAFDLLQRQAKLMAASVLVPKEFQGNLPNCTIALEMAARIGASPLMVMQNLYVVHGKPSWSSTFIIACINATGRFSPMAFELTGDGDKRQCIAVAHDLHSKIRLESPPISIDMAKKEGWYSKNGSKWQTMPELMLRYRAATLFGRLYAPEILMGMRSYEEVLDIGTEPEVLTPESVVTVEAPKEGLKEKMSAPKKEKPAAPKAVEEPVAGAEPEPVVVAENVDTATGEILDATEE